MPAVAETARTPHFEARVEGKPLPHDAVASVLEWVVESSLHLPDLCTMRIYDYDFKWLDSELFQEGHRLKLMAGWDPHHLSPVFDGEIVGMELDLSAHHTATLVVRAYDLSHRLHRGRKCLPFVDVKDSDVVKKIADAVGLDVEGKPTKVVREWVLQNNQTDWEFLTDQARRNGYELFMKGGKLHFLPAGARREFAKINLEWGKDLRSFRPRTSAAGQIETVEVRGWDPKTKQPIVATAKTPHGIPKTGGEADGAKWAKRFGASKTYVVDQPVHSQQEAEILAQSVRDQIGQGFLTADGLCDGKPSLMAGVVVEIKNIGRRFSGAYHVTSATHTYSAAEGYSTQFEVSGVQSGNLAGPMGDGDEPTVSGIGGNIVIGVVTDNRDPDGLGRVKVKYPWMADSLASGWARVVSQMAGKGRGMFNLPEIGDEVLVAFEHGETSRPYVLGQLWNGKDKPPSAKGNPELGGGSEVNRRGFHTRSGHQLNFDDTGGDAGIELMTQGGHKIFALDGGKKVEITTTGGHTFTLDDGGMMINVKSTSGHTLTLSDAGNSVTLKDNAGDVMTMSMGTVNLTALTMLNLAAPVININGSASVNTSAPVINDSAAMMGTYSGGIGVAVSGAAMVTVTGGALVGITGALVNIN